MKQAKIEAYRYRLPFFMLEEFNNMALSKGGSEGNASDKIQATNGMCLRCCCLKSKSNHIQRIAQ
jgi:hypothetical protein